MPATVFFAFLGKPDMLASSIIGIDSFVDKAHDHETRYGPDQGALAKLQLRPKLRNGSMFLFFNG
jgi:hypothetical protein